MVWQAIGHGSSTPFNEACQAKHRITTIRSTCKNQICPWITKAAAVLAAGTMLGRRWKTGNSFVRYEKSGRLAQVQPDLDKSQLTYSEATDLALEELFFGKLRVEDVLRPSLMVAASS